MDTQTIIDTIKQINTKYEPIGFRIVSLFGSYARGDADLYSDVDLAYMIDHEKFFKDNAFAKLSKIEEIRTELQELLHKKIDLIPANTSNKLLQSSLQEEHIAI